MKTFIHSASLLFILLTLSACGDTSNTTPATEVDNPANEVTENDTAAQAAETASAEGTLSITVDGTEKSFSHFPEEKNLTMSMSTMIQAKASAEATEGFSIVVMSFDLSKAELPASLKLGMREAMEAGDPAAVANMPKPMITYMSEVGVDYSSYATVIFDQYENGIATGRVEDIELEATDGDGAPVMLTNIRFEVAL